MPDPWEGTNMAANISGNSVAVVGKAAWHGIGKVLKEAMTSAQAIRAAGLDWEVEKVPAIFKAGKAMKEAPGMFLTIRQDTHEALGMVGNQYQVLQNRGAFSFFDAVVGIKEAMYHTAGALGKGETIWMLAKLPGVVRVIGDDVSEKYLLLTNRHDGGGSVKVLFTPIRVVCQNTLNIALRGAEQTYHLRHTNGLGLKVEECRKELVIIHAQFGIFEEAAKKLATTQLTIEASKKFFLKVADRYGEGPEKGTKELPARTKAIIEEMSRLFEVVRGAEMRSAKGTAWGAFNAVAEYVDFYRPTRGDDQEAQRASSLLFGTGRAMKQRAWDMALSLAK